MSRPAKIGRVPVIRPLDRDDVQMLTELQRANREFLAPWQPLRPDSHFTEAGQREAVEALLAQRAAGTAVPLVILDRSNAIAGTLTLASIIRGAFQSCSVGYWLAEGAQGQGLATDAAAAAELAFGELRLHRVQAETPHNLRSQRVLHRAGFERYGEARSYMHIAGEWQDNVLCQLLTPTAERVVTYEAALVHGVGGHDGLVDRSPRGVGRPHPQRCGSRRVVRDRDGA